MLAALESKLAGEIAQILAGRAGLSVTTAPLPLASPDPGLRNVRVAISELAPLSKFERERTAVFGDSPNRRRRRVVALGFTARVRAAACPLQQDAAQINVSREQLLEDLSLLAHALDDAAFRSGKALAGSAGDPGFEVLEFRLSTGNVGAELADGCLAGQLEYDGLALVWPPGVSQQGDEIRNVDSIIETLPATIRAARSVLQPGAQTQILVDLSSRRRTVDGQSFEPLQLAAAVLGDLPPGQLGTIVSGAPASEAAFRLHAVGQGPTEIVYAAPASGVSRARTEYVAVHLATPDGAPGLFVGSAPIRLIAEATP